MNLFSPRKEIPKEFAEYTFRARSIDPSIPLTYQNAMDGENRVYLEPAIREELNSILENGTWEVVERVLYAKELPYKWVFSLKSNEKGEIVRYKARLVVGGHRQVHGIDYHEVYAAVTSVQTIRILL
jgi:hypothetical protein